MRQNVIEGRLCELRLPDGRRHTILLRTRPPMPVPLRCWAIAFAGPVVGMLLGLTPKGVLVSCLVSGAMACMEYDRLSAIEAARH